MPGIPVPRRAEPPPASPLALYERLQVTDEAVEDLWVRQARVLERYDAEHRDSPDLTIEMPTGAGKTLVGLLIADWRRRTTGLVSAFICPNRQLARQVHDKAHGYGIPTVLLVGRSADWAPEERLRGLSAEATVVSVYHHVFNRSPRLEPSTVVFDDAHAAEELVAGNWSVNVRREHSAYKPLLRALGSVLDSQSTETLGRELSYLARPAPVLVGPADLCRVAGDVVSALDAHVADGESLSYALSGVRDNMAGCVAYVAWDGVLIRPLIAPTAFHPALAEADQRIYLSATVGAGGELERAFGRAPIARLQRQSDEASIASNGRRLVLMPGAASDAESAEAFVHRMVARLPRSLMLVPSQRQLEQSIAVLPDDQPLMTRSDVGDDLTSFKQTPRATLALANRYDGMDLPGDSCRLILMEGLPTGTHLQERFLTERLGDRSALRERIRTRLMQGMGRATRGRSDRAVVLLLGGRVPEFVQDPSNLRGLRPDVQAEIRFGIYLATEHADLDEVVDGFLAAGDAWQPAESWLREEIDAADVTPAAGAQELQAAVAPEIAANLAAWRGDFGEAGRQAQKVVRALDDEEVSTYRAFWKVMAAHWTMLAADETGEALDRRLAQALASDATSSSRDTQWRPVLPRQPAVPQGTPGSRAMRIADALLRRARSQRIDRHIDELEQWVGQDDASHFERGLERLGDMLGFETARSGKPAAPDGMWRDGERRVLWEAKTEQLAGDRVISATTVRQANSHPRWAANQLGWNSERPPVTLLVSPREELEPGAADVSDDHLRLVAPEKVRALAGQVCAMWAALAGQVSNVERIDVARRASVALQERGWTVEGLVEELEARALN